MNKCVECSSTNIEHFKGGLFGNLTHCLSCGASYVVVKSKKRVPISEIPKRLGIKK